MTDNSLHPSILLDIKASNSSSSDETSPPEESPLPEQLPVLPLKNTVVFPLTVLPLIVQKPRSVKLVDDAVLADRMVALVALRDPEVEEPKPADLYEMGTAAIIHRLARTPDGTLHIIVQGVDRIRVREYVQEEPYMRARIEIAPDHVEGTSGIDGTSDVENTAIVDEILGDETTSDSPSEVSQVDTKVKAEKAETALELEALVRSTTENFTRLVGLAAYLPDDLISSALSTDDPRQLIYTMATSTRMDMHVRQEILEEDSVAAKFRRLLDVLVREVEVLELGKKIQSDAQSGIEDVQREYFLREQLKAIQRELGQEDEQAVELYELEKAIREAGMSAEAEKEALRELDRLSKLPAAAAEYSVIRTYLGWLIELPWQVATEDNLDVVSARQVLDEDHYNLVRLKDRIIEFLAVRKLRQERASKQEVAVSQSGEEATSAESSTGGDAEPAAIDHIRLDREGVILCFVGPPGVGKTSLGRSIARAMGRQFIRQSLGGMRDEAEVRGHRRTYIGAMPGRIIQAIRRVGSRNPVFMLDEVDKLGSDFRGDPSSALLEVLDPEQNREFRDHYLDVPFDLSQVMFVATANMLDTIPAPLRDRMEILSLSGYTEQEKLSIAQGYLIPRQVRENGLREDEIFFERGALETIIREYTREAGVRELERQIGTVCRKVAAKVAAGETDPVNVTAAAVAAFLGKPIYYQEVAERTLVPGVATGLAWTPAGGSILFIEATKMRGSKQFTVTGQLGDVMRESAQAALSYVRANSEALGIDPDAFEKLDIHLHIPAGATPKDGPSAGVTMATALASLLREQPINAQLGMTGEITLRGQVLPVGGIKEKVLAAHRAGLRTICLPRHNEKDLEELPPEIKSEIEFVLVDRVEQVFEASFGISEGSNNDQIQTN